MSYNFSGSPYGPVKRRRWSQKEITTTMKVFEKHLETGKLPSFKEIQNIKSQYPDLKNRSSPQIKTWLHNQIKKK